MPERLTPHHDGSPLHVSTQAPALGEVVRVRLRVPDSFGPLRWVGTRSNPNREPRFDEAVRLPAPEGGEADGWQWWEAAVEVENPVHGYRWLLVGEDGRQHWLNQVGLSTVEVRDHDDFRLVAHAPAPEWAASSVLYQVFPDRFARSDAADPPPDARLGDPRRVDRPGRPRAAGPLGAVLRRRPRRGARAPRPPRGARHQPALPHARSSRRGRTTATTRRPSTTSTRCSAATTRWSGSSRRRTHGASGSSETSRRTTRATRTSGSARRRPTPSRPSAPSITCDDDGSYESWLGVPSLPKFDWKSPELRRRFIEGPDSVVARFLAPPFNLDGWRIDVANMTGRLGDEDLNESVRRTIRATMLEVNPDTILLGESTNDAASDFQGDAWHGAMTYTPFTRPLWSWLQQPGSPAGGGIGFALAQVPTFTGGEFVAAHLRFAAGFPWRTRLATMNALDTHDTPRFLTSARPGTRAGRVRARGDAAGHPGRLGGRRVRAHRASTARPRARRSRGGARARPTSSRCSRPTARSSGCAARTRCSPPAASAGSRSATTRSRSCANRPTRRCSCSPRGRRRRCRSRRAALSRCGCRGAGVRGCLARGIRRSGDALGDRADLRGVGAAGRRNARLVTLAAGSNHASRGDILVRLPIAAHAPIAQW